MHRCRPPRSKALAIKALIVATNHKPSNFAIEVTQGLRFRYEYLELAERLPASWLDYDAAPARRQSRIRWFEERAHVDFAWARTVARRVKAEGHDLVISMSERMAVPLALHLGPEVRHVAVLMGSLAPRWLRLIRLLDVAPRWTHVAALSASEADALSIELGLPAHRVSTLPTYVDTRFFAPARQALDEGYVASLGATKRDYPLLARAVATLPGVQTRIAAQSAWCERPTGLSAHGLPPNLQLVAHDHPMAIRQFLAASRLCAVPLRAGMGMWSAGSTTVLQAQALGKPVVCTYLPGIVDYLRHGETGFIVPPGNAAALAGAIDALHSHPRRAAEMGRAGAHWVATHFSLEHWLERMMTIIERATAPGASAPETAAAAPSAAGQRTRSAGARHPL